MKSTGEPVPIHHCVHERLDRHARPERTKCPRGDPGRVVRRRLAVQPLRLGLGRDLPVARVEVHPRRAPTPRSGRRPRASAGSARARPGTGDGLNSQVLYWVAHGESSTIASSGMLVPPHALEVVDHVVLVLVDVAALPEPVAPLGQDAPGSRSAGRTLAAAPPASDRRQLHAATARRSSASTPTRGRRRGRTGSRSPPSAPRPRSRGSRRTTAPARSRPAGCPRRRAARPGSRGRCSGGRRRAGPRGRPGRTACRAGRPGRRTARPSAGASRARPAAGHRRARAEARPGRPSRTRTSSARRRPPLSSSASVARSAEQRRTTAARARSSGDELLVRHDALGELDEVVVDRALGHPRAQRADQPPARRDGRSARTAAARSRPASDRAPGRPRRRRSAALGTRRCPTRFSHAPAIPCRR